MNRGQHRLVFNKERGIWMVVAEFVRSRRKGGGRALRRAATLALVSAAFAAHGRPAVTAPSATALPVPSTQAQRPFVFSGTGSITRNEVVNGKAYMEVFQATRTLGLNWDSFNLGRDASMTFDQADSGYRVLNRIWSNDPSVILGKLSAPGQIYLINQNGILFGNGAQVNVGGLVASALGVSNSLLEKGLPRNAGESLKFSWEGDAAGFANGFVAIDPGASITTASGSPVILLAPKTVENLGHISTGSGGEAILGAGGSVLLTAPADPNLRGLLVEVKSWQGVDAQGNGVTLGGQVVNSGMVEAPAGVVSLAALAVNQQGVVKAGKAVNLDGQIMLLAGTTETPLLAITPSEDKVQVDWAGDTHASRTQRVEVHQAADKVEIDWRGGFDVAAGQSVEFVQSGKGAVAYNYVYDPDRKAADGGALDSASAGRSAIDGTLKANGQFLLVNELGIDFGATADVSASNFVASALGLRSDIPATGLLSQSLVSSPAFALKWSDFLVTDTDAALASFRQATVDVAKGAQLRTSDNGYAILAGSRVTQAGTITTPGGQALVAAGARLYLKPPFNQTLRGFTAEVDPLYVTNVGEKTILSRGADANRVVNSGEINAAFGNITLVGHEIVQSGTLYSSTSLTRNGSIRLLARDLVAATKRDLKDGQIQTTADSNEQEQFVFGQQAGKLSFGAGSVTEVALDRNDGRSGRYDALGRFCKVGANGDFLRDTAGNTIPWEEITSTASQSFIASRIEAMAAHVDVEGTLGDKAGAKLLARGGDIAVHAAAAFGSQTAFFGDSLSPSQSASPSSDSGIHIGAGAKLDVSGAVANKSVADLFIEVELRGDEFAGNPVQRFGPLRGQKAWVDIRDKVALADLSGYFGKIGLSLEERAGSGGNIYLRGTDSVIVKSGATLDVSGGSVNYAAGTVKESKVLVGRGAYRLNDAPADLPYTGLVTMTRQELAYLEGKSAGSVELSGNSIAADGNFVGKTTRGERQRNLGDPATDRYAMPKGAKLVIRDGGQHFTPEAGASAARTAEVYRQAQIVFTNGTAAAASGLDEDDQARPVLELSKSLVDSGFTRFDIRSDGLIEVPASIALNLGPGGEFTASGRQVHVAGDIVASGGKITLATRDMSKASGSAFPVDAPYSTLELAAGATLDVAGRWVNDLLVTDPADYSVKSLAGGSIVLTSAHDIDIGAEATVDVSGGARLYRSSGKDKLETGNAGSIKLTTGGQDSETDSGKSGFDKRAPGDRRDASLFLDGNLQAFSLAKGGSLEIATSKIEIGKAFASDSRDWTRVQRLEAGQVGAAFSSAFFDRGGFFDFKLTGRDGVIVGDNVTLSPKPISWTLDGVRGYQNQATGTSLGDFTRNVHLHAEQRAAPTSISMATRSLNYGDLKIGVGATVEVDPLGSINLEAWRQLTVLGTLEARGGTIRLARPVKSKDTAGQGELFDYSDDLQSRSIFLGERSQLLTGGAVKLDAATRTALDAGLSAADLLAAGAYRGQVFAGGRVELDAGLGYLVTKSGSLIDVSGASGTLSQLATVGRGTSSSYQTMRIGSAGGLVSLKAREGMFLDGGYKAEGGKYGSGGSAGTAPAGTFLLRLAADGAKWDGDVGGPSGDRVLTLYQSQAELGGHQTLWPLSGLTETTYLTGKGVLDPGTYNGQARLDVAPLLAGGFGSWYLHGENQIVFDGTINASVANQLRLDSPVFGATSDASKVSLGAAAIQFGSFGTQSVAAPVGGAASIEATARDLALVGNFTMNGFGTSTFKSSGELHFDSVAHQNASGSETYFDGSLRGTGVVKFAAARLSPATFSDFTVDLSSDPASEIRITKLGGWDAAPAPLLSVAGKLAFNAGTIEHTGHIEAPLGQISFRSPNGSVDIGRRKSRDAKGEVILDGNGNVVYENLQSLTSVAATRLLPLGQTQQSGRDWVFLAGQWRANGGDVYLQSQSVAASEKAILVDAAHSHVGATATIDLSGGGEAVAWELTPGPGGKVDVLAQTDGKTPTTFVILPDWRNSFAPADAQAQAYYSVSNPKAKTGADGSVSYVYDPIPSLKPGDQIELADNPSGLSGRYTLLPASYALLPGAVLVTVKSTQDAAAAVGQTQYDGSRLVKGTKLAANADGSYSAYSQTPFAVELASRSVVLDRATYIETTATGRNYDNAGAQLPGDAGRLSVAGRSSLAFDPAVLGRGSSISNYDGRKREGRNFELDLAAPKIEVVEAGQTGSAGWSSFTKEKLNGFEASSLLLGGMRTYDEATASIETIATDVRIATGGSDLARDALQAPEILLAARNTATIENGSFVAANGDAPARDYMIEGDGAFARIAGGAQADVSRTGTVTRNQGDFILQDGAAVSGHALIFDATGENTLSGVVGFKNIGQAVADGGALSIGAKRINIVGDDSTPTDGLLMDNARIAGFGGLDQLRLTSYTTLDLYGADKVNQVATGTGTVVETVSPLLGTDRLEVDKNGKVGLVPGSRIKELVINAAGVAGHGATADAATISAESVRFENTNPGSAVFMTTGLGGGKLQMTAQTVTFGGNATEAMHKAATAGFAVRGFADVNIKASDEIRFAGTGVTRVDNNLTLDAGRVLAATGSSQLIEASGVGKVTGGSNAKSSTEIGGRLALHADSLEITGRIVAQAGRIDLAATGAGANATIKQGAVVSADGFKMAFADTKVHVPAGQVSIASVHGDVDIQTGARVSVSSAAEGGDAGRLRLAAQEGSVVVAVDTLFGSAAGDGLQGELNVDAKSVSLDSLTAAVGTRTVDDKTSAQFEGGWDIRRRDGDVTLASTIKSRRVLVAADKGNIVIGDGTEEHKGIIDASGAKGGEISLFARDGSMMLKGHGSLLARATEKVTDLDNAGTRGRGGRVTLGATGTGGKVITESASLIDVGAAAGSLAQGGKIVFRAAKSASIANKTDLNIQLAGSMQGATDISAEIVRSYNTGTALISGNTSGNSIGLTGTTSSIKKDLTADFSTANVKDLRTHLGFADTATTRFHVTPGVEITTPTGSTSDFTVSSDLDFTSLRFDGEPGTLTILAPRDLKINGILNDGFASTVRDAALNGSGNSWSYRLVAGADGTAANPLATIDRPVYGATSVTDPIALKGSIEVAANKFVRTGTGDIAMAARRDIKLYDKAAVYTAGHSDTAHPANFTPVNSFSGSPKALGIFPTAGGNLDLAAGERIVMVKTGEVAPDKRHVNEWLQRAGQTGATFRNTQWYARIGSFQQGFAAFGGGDMRMIAGTDIMNVTAAIPTSGRVPGTSTSGPQAENVKINGGGDMLVRAGDSVLGGQFYTETGSMRIEAGEQVASSSPETPSPSYTMLALGNADAKVTAGTGVALGDVFNPLWVTASYVDTTGSKFPTVNGDYLLRMGTYGDATALTVTSLAGDIKWQGTGSYGSVSDNMQKVAPSRLLLAALGGNLQVGTGGIYQAPGTDGQLDLLAAEGIDLGSAGVRQFDVAADLLPGILTPSKYDDSFFPRLFNVGTNRLAATEKHASQPWHAGDAEPSRLVALAGDIEGKPGSESYSEFSEAVRIEAGGSIRNLSLQIQHSNSTDVSRVIAGGNIEYDFNGTNTVVEKTGAIVYTTAYSKGIRIGGPGRLELLAGQDIDLGNSGGIVSRGNLDNFLLPEGGADLFLLAGGKPDYDGLRSFLKLGPEVGEVVLRDKFYTFLRDKGREALAGGGEASYEEGRAAIRALFPAASGKSGYLDLAYSQIKTEQGGEVDFLVPYGGITVGIATPSRSLVKKAVDQGIFTIRGGDIHAFVRDFFLVNQSRVFTLDGGDILVWADKGNIDAGSGAKTVSATPPPVTVIRDGQIVLDTSSSISGSGIGILASRADTPASDMDLFAPQGAIDAGDAGLRSTGNVNLGARVILNASNITAGGTVTGAPAVAAPAPVAAAPTSPANAQASDEQTAATATGANKESRQGILTVEVLAMGDGEECASGDEECLVKKRPK